MAGPRAAEPVAPAPAPAPTPTYAYRALVLRVIDGDTYDVAVDVGFRMTTTLPLRLAHVDAPEHGTTSGTAATSYVSGLLGALPAPVVVRTIKPADKYGRYLAEVFTATGKSVAAELLAVGLAKPYEGGTKLPNP